MIFSTQYFRPPFPDRHRWDEDLRRIREIGFTHIYIWATWSWIEPARGEFVFDDYDELFELAERHDLRVIVNTIAEVQPAWVDRAVPGADMVDHTGRIVTSSTLVYSNTGVMPGSCHDHPLVAELSNRFLEQFAARYADRSVLAAWDCWNEMRWSSQADGYVCYCDRTIDAFRAWLDKRHGGLDGLASAWRRRIASWEDVQPGRVPGRSYTELVAFQEFITSRTGDLLRDRVAAIRRIDPHRPIAAHTAFPATYFTGTGFLPFERALARGNDWDTAETVDVFGCSQFPVWFGMLPSEYGARIESGRSAALDAGKPYWVAELQGGSHRHGMHVTPPLGGAVQQRLVWDGYARGAKTVNFWCWRDEVFGREASGFGIIGEDGHADDRIAGMRRTAQVLRRWNDLLDEYQPEAATVGVVFSQPNYQLDWAADGTEAAGAGPSLHGYLYALERLQRPYRVVESGRLNGLGALQVLVVPWAQVIEAPLADALARWVRDGGTLLVESEAGAYDEHGFYRYPSERPFLADLGLQPSGRRVLDNREITFDVNGVRGRLQPASWLEHFVGDAVTALGLSEHDPTLVERRVGLGRVIALGTHAGLAYERERYRDFERFLAAVLDRATPPPSWTCSQPDGDLVQWRFGRSGDVPLLFVTNAGAPVTLELATVVEPGATVAVDLATDERLALRPDGGRRTLTLPMAADGWRALRLE